MTTKSMVIADFSLIWPGRTPPRTVGNEAGICLLQPPVLRGAAYAKRAPHRQGVVGLSHGISAGRRRPVRRLRSPALRSSGSSDRASRQSNADREDDPVEHVPAEGVVDLARHERGEARRCRTGRNRGSPAPCPSRTGGSVSATIAVAPMKPKFQPRPSRISAVQNCQSSMPDSATTAQPMSKHQPAATMLLRAEAVDQPAGEEARREHRHHVPGNAERGLVGGEAAADHGERRAGHHEAHQRIGADAADQSPMAKRGWRTISPSGRAGPCSSVGTAVAQACRAAQEATG